MGKDVCKQEEERYMFIQGIVSGILKYFLCICALFLKVSLCLMLQPSGVKYAY